MQHGVALQGTLRNQVTIPIIVSYEVTTTMLWQIISLTPQTTSKAKRIVQWATFDTFSRSAILLPLDPTTINQGVPNNLMQFRDKPKVIIKHQVIVFLQMIQDYRTLNEEPHSLEFPKVFSQEDTFRIKKNKKKSWENIYKDHGCSAPRECTL